MQLSTALLVTGFAIVAGQKCEVGLVPSSACSGGTCYSWRHATCKGSRFCVCEPGSCIVDGECVTDGCAKATGGSCKVASCNGWRHSTCSSESHFDNGAACVCGEDECAIAGECVAKGDCPRYTGSSCTTYLHTGFFNCGEGTCSDAGYCECDSTQCAVDGSCVAKGSSVTQLSIASAKARNDGSSLSVMGCACVLMTMTLFAGLARRMQQKRDTATDYVEVM